MMDQAMIEAVNKYMEAAARMTNDELNCAIAEARYGGDLREDGKIVSSATDNVYSALRWAANTDDALELLREMNEQSVTDSLSTTASWHLLYRPRHSAWCAFYQKQQSYYDNWWVEAKTPARAISEAWYVLWHLNNLKGALRREIDALWQKVEAERRALRGDV